MPFWRAPTASAGSARPMSPARCPSLITGSRPSLVAGRHTGRELYRAELRRAARRRLPRRGSAAVGITAYGAVQFQDFYTPAYSETDVTGGGFGLTYNATNATDVRTELGARFDDPAVVYGKPLVLFGRVA
jgi:hypothetical protein